MKKESSYLFLFLFCTSRFRSLHSDVQGHPHQKKKKRKPKKVFSGLGVFFCPPFSCLFESFPFWFGRLQQLHKLRVKSYPQTGTQKGGKKAVTACENEGREGKKGLFSKVPRFLAFYPRKNYCRITTISSKHKKSSFLIQKCKLPHYRYITFPTILFPFFYIGGPPPLRFPFQFSVVCESS